ncbi:MAG: diadenylate cyclase CdaA [Candidatus Eremiobacteraeota bacterium]|nr:diadenylate cyclase CdaA [Candidatus Eremiobacteraeota bacterium]
MPELRNLVGLTDLLDVLATSILIYYLLLLIRGTRAVQILLGVLVLLLLLGVANVLHLLLLGTILQVIVVGAAVTLPIVFQPELRRALEQLGRGGLLRIRDREERSTAEDRWFTILAQAAFNLSRSRHGALIVIEQFSGLKEFVETGTTLDASLSVELLLTIFAPRSPLHDGAVIVREGVIEAAGCFLPLAEQSSARHRLGTRHRAALGLSEQTDAVVIVISEESGNIAIAREGRLSAELEDQRELARVLLACTRAPYTPNQAPRLLIAKLRSKISRRRPNIENAADIPQKLST